MKSDSEESEVDRIDTLDELEFSIHYTISTDPIRKMEEYEIHAGMADEIAIRKSLVERVNTLTGIDIRNERVRCGADIRVIDDV